MNPQTVGNIGLFYVCYRLSRLGWNVMPTARNAKGVDIVVYSQDASCARTIQVKALSRRDPVALGPKLDHLLADYVIICTKIISDAPECFVLTPHEVRARVHRGVKDNKTSFWLQPRDYDTDEFRDGWERLGDPLARSVATLDDLLEAITAENLHREVSTGLAVGGEEW